MILPMKRGLDSGAVILGVFVDQNASFAMGVGIALSLPLLGLTNTNVGQALYEASCIVCGIVGGFTAARFAGRSMVAHGIAVGVTSLGVSTLLGLAMRQEMFDARGIFFSVIALVASPLGGWLASLLPMRRPHRVAVGSH